MYKGGLAPEKLLILCSFIRYQRLIAVSRSVILSIVNRFLSYDGVLFLSLQISLYCYIYFNPPQFVCIMCIKHIESLTNRQATNCQNGTRVLNE